MDRLFTKNPRIVAREIAGEHILVPIPTTPDEARFIYVLNEVAARIWDLIDGQRSNRSIRDAILEEYEVDSLEVEQDVVALVGQLESVGAVHEVRDGMP